MQLWFIGVLAAVAVIIGAVGVGYRHGWESGAYEIKTKWDEERAQVAIRSQELQITVDKLRETKNRELTSLRATVSALSNILRDRPDRPAIAASSAGDGTSGCTGAELYRPDSDFLLRESARADTIRLALKNCQAAYEKASK